MIALRILYIQPGWCHHHSPVREPHAKRHTWNDITIQCSTWLLRVQGNHICQKQSRPIQAGVRSGCIQCRSSLSNGDCGGEMSILELNSLDNRRISWWDVCCDLVTRSRELQGHSSGHHLCEQVTTIQLISHIEPG